MRGCTKYVYFIEKSIYNIFYTYKYTIYIILILKKYLFK